MLSEIVLKEINARYDAATPEDRRVHKIEKQKITGGQMNTKNTINDSGKRIKYGDDAAIREPDDGKGRPDLISPYALTRLAKHYAVGSAKYTDRNWENGMPFSRYTASLFRHLIAWMKKDSSEDHLAAIAWNAFAIMHHQELGEDERWDDMPDRRNIPPITLVAEMGRKRQKNKAKPFVRFGRRATDAQADNTCGLG